MIHDVSQLTLLRDCVAQWLEHAIADRRVSCSNHDVVFPSTLHRRVFLLVLHTSIFSRYLSALFVLPTQRCNPSMPDPNTMIHDQAESKKQTASYSYVSGNNMRGERRVARSLNIGTSNNQVRNTHDQPWNHEREKESTLKDNQLGKLKGARNT